MSDFASAIDGIEPAFRRLVGMNPFRLNEGPSPVPAGRPSPASTCSASQIVRSTSAGHPTCAAG